MAGVDLRPLARLMRERWRTVSRLWDDHKQGVNQLTLLGQLDYRRKLSRQLAWRSAADDGACHIVYTKSGRPTAARLRDRHAIVDHTLYWMPCGSGQEAAYLLALINSDALRDAVEPHMSRGLWVHATYTSTFGTCQFGASTLRMPFTQIRPPQGRPLPWVQRHSS